MNDPGITMVEEFHRQCGFVINEAPKLPQLRRWEQNAIKSYTEALYAVARKLRQDAAECNALQQHDLGVILIRLQLQVEETAELWEAIADGDLPHVLHEITDLSYVTDGTYLTFGLQALKPAADAEVHRANMSRGSNSDMSGRSIKGPDYQPPDMARILRENC